MSDNREKGADEAFCKSCGAIIKKEAEICPKCGVRQRSTSSDDNNKWLTTLLVEIFLGEFGIHRFMNGKVGTGLLMLFTLGGCGIWWLIDLILILTGNFTDANGNKITSK